MNKVLELERPEIKIKIDSIKLVDVNKLKLNPENRNHHPQEQIDELARHYAVHGMRTPIIVSNLSGHIVSGNGRFLAAKRAGLNELPVSYQDFESPEKEYAFGIADNGLSLWSELDFTLINEDITDFGPDFNIDDLGLKDFTIDVADKYEDKDADEIPEVVEPKAKLGEIYKLGNHRLMCGDSTSESDVVNLMNGEKADMVYTDPPYGIEYSGNHYQTDGGNKVERKNLKVNRFEVLKGDKTIFNMSEVLKPFGYVKEVFVWGAQNFASVLPISTWICWDRKLTESADKSLAGDFDLCWSKNKHKMKMYRVTWHGIFGHSSIDDGAKKVHPTMKPVKLIEAMIEDYGKDCMKVVDLFGGSGSTLIACEKTNRKCFMMELDPHYIDVIIARWESFTGQKAELINV